MSRFDEFRRHLGLRGPITVETAMDLIGEAWRWVEDHFSEPALRMQQLRTKTEQLREFMATDRSCATDKAVYKGGSLLQMRALNGRTGWDQVLRAVGISRRTAQNLIALALFARRSPDVFDKLKRLGPTKLYRLARLAPEALKDLQLDIDVPTERGAVKLRNLTDRELESHLRKINPPKIRTTQEKLKAAGLSMRRMIENLPKDARPPREDLEMIRDVLRDASLRVMDLLGRVA